MKNQSCSRNVKLKAIFCLVITILWKYGLSFCVSKDELDFPGEKDS